MEAKAHWETVYQTKRPDEMSWYQRDARTSRELIARVMPNRAAHILDAGGGASTLVDGLVSAGYSHITVLDVSMTALGQARRRLGDDAAGVTWLDANVLTHEFTEAAFDVWHDRAVFHFLTRARDRAQYVAQVRRAVRPGGYVLVATFAENGPTRCSGLPVARYTRDTLHGEFGAEFLLVESAREDHVTPSGVVQPFVYCVCRLVPHVAVPGPGISASPVRGGAGGVARTTSRVPRAGCENTDPYLSSLGPAGLLV